MKSSKTFGYVGFYRLDGSTALDIGVLTFAQPDPVPKKPARPKLRLVSSENDRKGGVTLVAGQQPEDEEQERASAVSRKKPPSRRLGMHATTYGRVLQLAPRSPALIPGR